MHVAMELIDEPIRAADGVRPTCGNRGICGVGGGSPWRL
jgi:hypothetical protein